MAKFKKVLLYILVYIVALVLGGILAIMGEKISGLSFLSYTMNWGFNPIDLDLNVIYINFGLRLNINMGQILMILVAVFTAPKIVGKLSS